MFDVIIIGCGVSGAAIAFQLSKYNLKIAVLEKENDVSLGASKANSGIMHAGFDPEPGTLMAKLNVRGVERAMEVFPKLDVPYKKCGAMVIAFSDDEMKSIEALYQRGIDNGVKNQRLLTKEEALSLEPNLSKEILGALLEPESGIVIPWEICLALAETAVINGTQLFLNREVKNIRRTEQGWKVETCLNQSGASNAIRGLTHDSGETIFEGKVVINAAGINADKIHDMVSGHKYDITPRRGQYYLLDKDEGNRCSRTIFQAPSKNGKGVLVSPTAHGNLIVGPDSDFVEGENTTTSQPELDFVRATAAKSVPSINFGQNIRNFSGVRARTAEKDFIIEFVDSDYFIDVAGICSPGLSACLGIAEYVENMIRSTEILELIEKEQFIDERKKVRFRDLTVEEKKKVIGRNPAYAHVICRCETVTEGEILDALKSPVPPVSLDGIKRRTGSGMGRCQGGFCGPAILKILSREMAIPPTEVLQEKNGSNLLAGIVDTDAIKGEDKNV